MKKLHFDYSMKIKYSEMVSKCNFTIKCFPQNNARQAVKSLDIRISPPAEFCFGVDGLNNKQIYGLNSQPHDEFEFKISGDVFAGMSDYEEVENDNISMIFGHPYGLNMSGEKIKEYFAKLNLYESIENKSNYKIAEYVMNKLFEDFTYESNVTNIRTNAEEAFVLGRGVCQDYAHIFIALMHLAGVPARYVTGLIIGEGASHAWVEILDNKKWYGFDPTNNEIVSDKHIKIGIGRDAHDCTINRGIMHGGGLHTQEINVNVMEIGEV